MNLVGLIHKSKFLLNENSSTILTGMGVVGTVSTAYLTGRASFRAAEIIARAEEEIARDEIRRQGKPNEEYESSAPIVRSVQVDLTRWNKVKLVWHFYIPAVVSGATTITAIVLTSRISSKKIAALTVASGISERALQEYKAKVIEKLGERQNIKIRDEVAQDHVNNNPPTTSEIIITGNGDVLCVDMLTGRYFMSNAENIKRAENKINHNLIQHMDASLSEFYEEIGLAPTSYSDTVGWNAANLFSVHFSTTMTPDQRPCLAIDFHPHPFQTYSRFHE